MPEHSNALALRSLSKLLADGEYTHGTASTGSALVSVLILSVNV